MWGGGGGVVEMFSGTVLCDLWLQWLWCTGHERAAWHCIDFRTQVVKDAPLPGPDLCWEACHPLPNRFPAADQRRSRGCAGGAGLLRASTEGLYRDLLDWIGASTQHLLAVFVVGWVSQLKGLALKPNSMRLPSFGSLLVCND